MKPRFLAARLGIMGLVEREREREREGLTILEVCCRRPMRMNSALEELRVRLFDVIQDEMRVIVD